MSMGWGLKRCWAVWQRRRGLDAGLPPALLQPAIPNRCPQKQTPSCSIVCRPLESQCPPKHPRTSRTSRGLEGIGRLACRSCRRGVTNRTPCCRGLSAPRIDGRSPTWLLSRIGAWTLRPIPLPFFDGATDRTPSPGRTVVGPRALPGLPDRRRSCCFGEAWAPGVQIHCQHSTLFC